MTHKTFQRLAALGILGALTFGGAATALAAPADSDGSATTESIAAPSGEAMPVGDLPGWHQIFTDDFTTAVPVGSFPAAVSSKWGAYPSPWKDTSGYGTYSPSNVVSVAGGVLNEDIHTEGGTAMVAAIQPKIPSGSTYGRYAVRYRSDSLADYKIAWMLWPDNNNNQTDGEIDFPEMNLDQPSAFAFMHRTGSTGPDDQSSFNVAAGDQGWHTAVIEWSPDQVLYSFDGVEIGRTSVRTPTTAMHWVLQTETALDLTAAPAAAVRGNVQVDWAAAWAFDPSTADTIHPVTAITAPAGGATVTNTNNLTASASDNVGVVGVQFQLDGNSLGAELTSPTGPYTTPWNTGLTANGTHTVTVVARDDAGNHTTSAPITVTVANGGGAAPTATSIPKPNATVWPIESGLSVTFSEAVTGVDGGSFTLANTVTGAIVPATVTYKVTANAATATLKPFNNLTPDAKYTATLTSDIQDAGGTPLATSSWTFVTGPRPTVVSTSPAAGATNVNPANNIIATASADLTNVGWSTFTLKSAAGTTISAAATFDAATNITTLDPAVALAANTTYTATMSDSIKDVVGNPLLPLSWSFTTGAAAGSDTTAPTVSVVPKTNSTVWPIGSGLNATFSEAVTGINGTTFSLKNNSTGATVAAVVTATSSTATLKPSSNLVVDTWYTATLTGGITDTAGNQLATVTITFLTGPRPTATPTTPAAGATNVSRSTTITATASEDLTNVGWSTYTLKNAAGTTISATATFNTTTNIATLAPAATLAANTTYTVAMSSNIKDVAGNPLQALTWSFTTGA